MSLCCGKDCNTNFCPVCGKPQDTKSGLRGVLRYITSLFEKARKELEAVESRVKIHQGMASGYQYKDAVKDRLLVQKRHDKYKDWQEALIKAIDGE